MGLACCLAFHGVCLLREIRQPANNQSAGCNSKADVLRRISLVAIRCLRRRLFRVKRIFSLGAGKAHANEPQEYEEQATSHRHQTHRLLILSVMPMLKLGRRGGWGCQPFRRSFLG